MKDISKMIPVELRSHMMSLISEVNHLKTLLQPNDMWGQPHATGHIITTIETLEYRIEDIKSCLISADAVESGYYVKNTEQDASNES